MDTPTNTPVPENDGIKSAPAPENPGGGPIKPVELGGAVNPDAQPKIIDPAPINPGPKGPDMAVTTNTGVPGTMLDNRPGGTANPGPRVPEPEESVATRRRGAAVPTYECDENGMPKSTAGPSWDDMDVEEKLDYIKLRLDAWDQVQRRATGQAPIPMPTMR